MENREIQNINFMGMSKEQIIATLGKVLGDYNLIVTYDMLNEYLTPEQMSLFDNAIEDEGKSFYEEEGEHEGGEHEDEFLEMENNEEDRSFVFSTSEEGKLVTSSIDSKNQHISEIGELKLDGVEIAKLLEFVRNGIEYTTNRFDNTKQNDMFGNAFEKLTEVLSSFSASLTNMEKYMNKTETGSLSTNDLLEIMRLTGASFSVTELAPLVNPIDAEKARNAMEKNVNEMYQPNAWTTEEKIKSLREEEMALDHYRVTTVGNKMVLKAPSVLGLPQLDFDRDRMGTPDFTETIINSIEKSSGKIDERFSSFYFDELKKLISAVVQTRGTNGIDFDMKSIVQRMAQDPKVVLMAEKAKTSFDNMRDFGDKDKNVEIDGIDI